MKRWLGALLLACLTSMAMASTAHAQTPPPDPWNTPHPAPPAAGAPPAPPPYAPPPGYVAPNPYAAWGPHGINPQSFLIYQSEKKNAGVALLINFLFPGAGSIYADHLAGAFITWALIAGGFTLAIWSAQRELMQGDESVNAMPIVAGSVMVIGGFVYGYVDAYLATKSYNRALAQRLRLPEGIVLGPAAIRAGPATAWGPALGFRF